jgi:hypothetical protein
LRLVEAPGAEGGALLHAALAASSGAVLGFAAPGDRLMPGHVEKLVAALYAGGADAVYGDLVRASDGGIEACDLSGRSSAAAVFPWSTLLGRREAFERTGAFGPGAAGAATWLVRFVAAARPRRVPLATVVGLRPRPAGAHVLSAAAAALSLDPTELLREVVSLHARLAASGREGSS